MLLLSLILLLASCSRFGEKEVARVNGQSVHENELMMYYPESNFFALPPEQKDARITKLCDDYLTRFYLEDRGDLDSGEVKWEVLAWKTRELANHAYQDVVIDNILTPEAMRELYRRLKYEVHVSHILLGFDNERGLNERSREEAEKLANEIRGNVNEDNFRALAERYSDDASVEENGGDLGWGRSGHWVPAFEDAVYALEPGETGGPVETPFGFHIIRMHERREVPVEPFERMRRELREMAFSKWRNRFMLRENAVFDSLIAAYPLTYKDSLLEDFIDRFTRLSANVFYSEQFDAYDILGVFPDTLCVGSIGDRPIDKDWITQYLKLLSLQKPARFESVKSFKGFVERNRLGCLLYESALDMGLQNSPEYRQRYNVYLGKKSSDLFSKRYVFEKINPGIDELTAFYESVKDSMYFNEPTVQVREVLVKDSALAVSIRERAEAGESMAKLATEYSVRNIGKKREGLIPPVKRAQYGEMGIAAFNMLDGEIAGPFKVGKHYSVIRRIKEVPGSYKSMRQVSYRLLTDYRSAHMNEKREKELKKLRNTYSVKVNPSYLKP
jgi:parvulin-like peptidyl-prolyl isomerase